jgi:AcrR family transcriptional regulator
MSQRHSTIAVPSERPVLDEADSALLDAARTAIMAVGVRRTTLTDVARRAGVSRMTVYRRFPDVAALVQSLMTREFLALIDDSHPEAGSAPTSRERFAAGVAEGAYRLSEHELFQRILDVDPDLMLPYALDRYGAFQKAVLATFTEQLSDGMADGSIRTTDPALLAATTELMFRGFVFAARAEGIAANRQALRDELQITLERGLRP